jgi:hypothetical protein
MIEVIFTDGSVVQGASYREAEDALRASQPCTFPSRRAFRREMRRRAVVWGGVKTTFTLVPTSKLFLHSLADVGMCRIDKSNERGLI